MDSSSYERLPKRLQLMADLYGAAYSFLVLPSPKGYENLVEAVKAAQPTKTSIEFRPMPAESAAAIILASIKTKRRAKASRENGKKGGRPKNRICPICKKSVSVYRFADGWRFNQHYTDEKREGSIYPYYECSNSYAVAD